MDHYNPSVENLRLIIGSDILDGRTEALLEMYYRKAENFVLGYCNEEIATPVLIEIAEDIALFNYRNIGVENIISETKGRLNDNYREGLPPEIYKRLNDNRRMRFV